MGGSQSRPPFRIVLAGPGKAGKSTVQKAARLAMSSRECADKAVTAAYSEDERKFMLKKIRRNIIDSTLLLTKTLRENEDKFKPTTEEKELLHRKIPVESRLWGPLEVEQAEAIVNLWNCGLLKRVFDDMFSRDENSVDSCAAYFLPQATRFAGKDDVHNKLLANDVLYQREETKKIEISEFVYPLEAPPAEQTVVNFLDVGGQKKWLDLARTDPTHTDFVFRSRSYFVIVPIGDFDVFDEGVDRVSRSLKVLLDLFYMEGREFSPQKKIFVVFLNKSDTFKLKLDDGRFKRFQTEFKGHDWERELNPLLKRLEDEFEETKKKCCCAMLPRCCPGAEFTEQGQGEDTPYAKYAASQQCVRELATALGAKYTGPDGDEACAIKFFVAKVQKIIDTAKVVARKRVDAWDDAVFEGQSKILQSTAIDFSSMEKILRGKVFDEKFLMAGLLGEAGFNEHEGDDDGELELGGASPAVVNPMRR